MQFSSCAESLAPFEAQVREPKEIEIGCSYGEFLVRLAKERPESTFIGVEINSKDCESAKARVWKENLKNVTIENTEAHQYLADNIDDNSIKCIHLYFPTPYSSSLSEKYPLAKRINGRLVNGNFMIHVQRILQYGGVFRVVTDHLEYRNEIVGHCQNVGLFQTFWTPPMVELIDGLVVATGCEYKYREMEYTIHSLQFIKA